MTALEQIGLFIQLIAQGVARLAELSLDRLDATSKSDAANLVALY